MDAAEVDVDLVRLLKVYVKVLIAVGLCIDLMKSFVLFEVKEFVP